MSAGFARFRAAYARQVASMARLLLGRWKAPSAVSAEDVEQEVWMGAWRAWERYAPSRGGMTREAFALCCGRLDAQRWLQVQRNAPRRSSRASGRYPMPEAALGEAFYPGALLELAGGEACVVAPGQEAVLAFKEAVERGLMACCSPAEKRAMKALLAARFDRGEAEKRSANGSRGAGAVKVAWSRIAEAVAE